jgi:hypothetical protein
MMNPGMHDCAQFSDRVAGWPVTVEDQGGPDVPIIDRETRREPTRRRLTELEGEVHELSARVDALLEAITRLARQHYCSPLLPENTLRSALYDARRR